MKWLRGLRVIRLLISHLLFFAFLYISFTFYYQKSSITTFIVITALTVSIKPTKYFWPEIDSKYSTVQRFYCVINVDFTLITHVQRLNVEIECYNRTALYSIMLSTLYQRSLQCMLLGLLLIKSTDCFWHYYLYTVITQNITVNEFIRHCHGKL